MGPQLVSFTRIEVDELGDSAPEAVVLGGCVVESLLQEVIPPCVEEFGVAGAGEAGRDAGSEGAAVGCHCGGGWCN